MSNSFRSLSRGILLAWLVVFLCPGAGSRAADLLPPGFRPLPPSTHALVGGTVVVKPGETNEGATIILRDGLIKEVGKGLAVPADARVWDMKGLTIYAGFIDPYLVLGASNAPPVSSSDSEPVTSSSYTSGGSENFFGVSGQRADRGNAGPGYGISRVTPEYRAVLEYSPRETVLEGLREAGFTAGVVAPARGIIRGTSALVALAPDNPNDLVLKPDVFQHIAFEAASGEERAYPGSLMGAIAVVRQSFFDAQHYALEQADYQKRPGDRKPPEFDPALEALQPAAKKKIPVAFEPGSALMISRAAQVSRELGLEFCLVSSGQEWRRPDLAKATAATFIVPLNFPVLPKLPSEADWDQVRLDQLRAWDWASENAALLRQQGLEIALTTYGLSDKKKFRANLRLALDRGLSEGDALAALTTVPARLCGVQDRLGTIEPGKLANLTVVEGAGYFVPDAKVREVWIKGRVYRPPVEEPKSERGDATRGAKPEEGAPKPKEEPEKKADPSKPDAADPARKTETAGTEEKPADEKKDNKRKEQTRELQKNRVARSPLEDRGSITNPSSILIRNVTLWTSGAKGVLTNASLLVSGGKIQEIGNLKAESGSNTLLIEGEGLNVTPGLIDCHSHTAILGSVNESSLPCTAMVRISDVVNSETEKLQLQLAGGVTAVNLLHGSANPIGGQNCVIKLREGAGPEDLIFQGAPAGIKFALGENVKQSNAGERFTTRFPQSRMGVRTFVANRFTAARQYLQEKEKSAGSAELPPGRNLELEAIGEILQGKRLIHCHAYRQDEILMMIRLMESFGVTIGTFQHVLEGYKVADEIAKHGAGASSFSDWWAYKFEVYDAIPYNGSLMRDRGVIVSFNSDSSELARRLYTEAAKAVRFGGTSEAEALKFVTLNPAKQLRIDKFVGSLEPGKDADFAVWSRSPLDSRTVCLQTWIDGKKYFDRALAAERTTRLKKEREDLIAKAKKISSGPGGRSEPAGGETADSFFRVALEHEFDGRDRDCMDEERDH